MKKEKEEKYCFYCNKRIFIYSKKTCNNMKCMIRFIKDNIPNNIPITFKLLNQYYKEGKCIETSLIFIYFGTIKNFCDICGLIDGSKKKHIHTKENIIKLLQDGNKEFGNNLSPTDLILSINRKNGIDIRGSCKKLFGSGIKACQVAGIQTKKHYWTNNEIILALQELYNRKNGNLNKCDINKSKNLFKAKLVRDRFGSFDKAAEYAGIEFIPFTDFKPTHFNGRKGLKEDFVLDVIEKEKGIKLIRQYQIGRKFVDAFHPETNTVYEVDEKGHFHPYQQIKDYFRQQHIQKLLGCDFIRIKQDDFLSRISNTVLTQFEGL
jgi:hypothetical protein